MLARTFKAKYFPSCSIQECRPKPHHSWCLKNIIQQEKDKLRERKWWVGNGYGIPLNHKNWFHYPSLNLNHPSLTTGKVGDLIDQHTNTWKTDRIRSLYPFPQASTILQIPISKTGSVQDKILWKYSKEWGLLGQKGI